MSHQAALSLQIDGHIATITIDVPGETQNTLKAAFVGQFNQIIDTLESNPSIRGAMLVSGKPGSFVAGADISMLKSVEGAAQATELARSGQRAFARLSALKFPVVAVIDGTCLGGGLELALACHRRVASDARHTRLGLPEVQLGVLPGGGGTQRLPRLIGIMAALELMLSGRQIDARRAQRLGLVDTVVPQPNLQRAARRALDDFGTLIPASKKVGFSFKAIQALLLEKNTWGRQFLFAQARKKLQAKTQGNYPAPEAIISAIEAGQNDGFAAGLELEATLFGELVMSPQAQQLMGLFFAQTELKKSHAEGGRPAALARIGVLGGGLMGAGIAYVSIDKAGVSVRLKDRDEQGVAHGLGYIDTLYRKRLKRRRIGVGEIHQRMARVTGTTDYSGFKHLDLVIEAVFENLELKQQMLHEVEHNCSENTIFASNTSSIPIHDIAASAARPENVIGMHYFSPVEKMPLLEIVKTARTSTDVVQRAVAFGRAQGKTVIVVNDAAGFYTSRVLGPYMNEAGYLLAQGYAIETIDLALVQAGFPVGPFTLLDEVGIDVGTKIAPVLERAFGERMAPPAIFDHLAKAGRMGRKNGRGFYRYDGRFKGIRPVDETVYADLQVTVTHCDPDPEIARRCLLQFVNEACRCLEEGVLDGPRDGDIGAVFGLGFPPFLGGPFRYVDQQGAATVVEQLAVLAEKYSSRFTPCDMLQTMAKKARQFYPKSHYKMK